MHSSLPYHFYIWVDNKNLGPDMPDGLTEGILHGVYARDGQKMLCHVLLKTGAHWSGIPLHQVKHKPTTETLIDAEPWSCMGTKLTTTFFDYLEGLNGRTLKDNLKFRHTGIVIDWNDGFSRYPEEHKPLSLVALEQGNFGLLPNNYFKLFDKHFTEKLEDTNIILKKYKRGDKVYWET